MGVGAAVAGVVGGSILSSKAKKKGARNAEAVQRDFRERVFDLQEEILEENAPVRETFRRMVAGLEDRLQGPEGGFDDPVFTDAVRQAEAVLSASGNLQSGFSQDVILRAAQRSRENARNQRTSELFNLGNLAGGFGAQSTKQALSLFQPAGQATGNISSLELAQGQANAGLFDNIAGLGLASGFGLFGEGAGSGLFTSKSKGPLPIPTPTVGGGRL